MVGLWTESSYNFTIDHIEYNPEGSEADGEYVVLTNHENYNVSMIGWFLQDEAAQTAYEFNFTIANNTSIRIYTGEGIDNSTTLYCQQQSVCYNQTTLKNVTVNGIMTLKNVMTLLQMF